ncbi:MAG: phosphoesterase [Clostridiales bacterium]|jgi:membrane-associated phospholipid phosphatase|nr:phosphoesterase [Clostridiales bacterium]
MKKIANYIRENKYVLLTLYVPIYLIGFFTIEKLVADPNICWLTDIPALDSIIPFWEIFIIPYMLWYPYMFVVGLYLLFVKNGPAFTRFMWGLIITFTTCLIFFVLFPNCQNQRIDLEVFARDNIFTRMVGSIYAVDTNTNVLPSGHVVGSVVAWWGSLEMGIVKRNRWLRILTHFLMVTISLSTVFVKQHAILDVFASISLLIPLYFLLYKGGFAKIWRVLKPIFTGKEMA